MDKYLGKRLDGRYEMRELIGVGGMAYVYKAYDAVDDRIVAVKILKDEFLNSDEFVRRFRNESKAIAILNHPNIVKVLDVGFGERLQYIVMEYIDGITLKEYLGQRKDIRWKEAVHFTVQILRALQHAHDKGIVHRDIKPQNIMLLSDGTIKVTDFGIARLTRSDMKATVEGNKAIGSVHYISPEQARGEITDEKTDLYAVGIMLYETLTGCLPFEADNAVSVAIMQMQSEAKAPHLINAEIPEGLEQITLKAMQKDTAKRYQSAAEMLNDFDEFKKNPSIKFEYTYMMDETPTRYVDAITRVRGDMPEPKPKKEVPVQPKKKKSKNETQKLVLLIVAASLLTILLVLLIVSAVRAFGGHTNWFYNLFGIGSFKKQADEVVVEKFIGKMYYTDIEGVTEYEQKYNFKIKWEDANNPEYKKGQVYKQEPAYGKTVKKGATITLYVNSATPKDIVLDVRAQIEKEHKNDVRKLLQDAGFVVKEITSSSDQVDADHVISININKGQAYAYGTEVTMVVSTGPSKLPPIEFPAMIIGENKETAAAILKSHGFVGEIVYADTNYTDIQYAEKGKVMGVMIDGVVMETLPEEISADGSVTLLVSNGFKDVMVELEWPEFKYLLDVRVIVGTNLDNELGSKYNGYKPAATDKIVFALTKHPAGVSGEYNFEVQIKKHDASGEAYKTYATLRINPVEGTWTMVGYYQPLPGISPDVAVPNVIGQTASYDSIINEWFNGFAVTVVDSATGAAVIAGEELKIEEILNGNSQLMAGDKLPKNSPITVKVSSMAIGTDATISSDIFDKEMSLADLNGALSNFVITAIKDQNGATVTTADGLRVARIVWQGSEVAAGDVLPTGAEIEVFVTDVKVMVPDGLVGQSRDAVLTKLTELGFVVETRGANGSEAQNGEVLQITCNGENAAGKLWAKGSGLLVVVKDPA